jgi:hypothetical protein
VSKSIPIRFNFVSHMLSEHMLHQTVSFLNCLHFNFQTENFFSVNFLSKTDEIISFKMS